MHDQSEITQLLEALGGGRKDAYEALLPLVYSQLRGLAEHYMRQERPDHTLQATALVNEAYLRMVGLQEIQWRDRAHFLAVAAGAMRRILIDHARTHRRKKRAGSHRRTSLDTAETFLAQSEPDVLELHDVLEVLARREERKARVVELRYFGGMTQEEIAEVLGVSRRTVDEDWRYARAWLYAALSDRENVGEVDQG